MMELSEQAAYATEQCGLIIIKQKAVNCTHSEYLDALCIHANKKIKHECVLQQ